MAAPKRPDLSKLEDSLVRGRITRRDFIAGATAVGLSAGAATALMSETLHAATPKRGGRLIMGYSAGTSTETLEQTQMTTGIDANRAWGVYNGLARVTRKLEAEPMLAESWETKPGAKWWTFKLREGVEFHNGKTLDAEDVIDSLSRHLGEDSKSPAKPLLEDIVDMKADGKYRVNFTLEQGNALLPMTFAADYHSTIHPAGWTDFMNPVGTGPYTIASFDPGVRCLFKRFDNYWKSGVAHLDEIEQIPINDTAARINAIRTGEVHFIEEVEPKLVAQLERVEGIDIVSAPSSAFVVTDLMCDRPPTDNLDVRLAMKYAMDRELVVKQVFAGHAVVGNDHPVAPIMADFCSDIPQREYDPDKARFHWKKAGMEGQTLDFHTSNAASTGAEDMAIIFKESARAAGMDINVVRRPIDGYWSDTWMKVPVNQSGWNARPTADLILTIAHKSDAPWNETQWKNERFDTLLLEGRVELDKGRRREIYCELQRLLHEEGGALLPAFTNYVDAKQNILKGWDPHPAFSLQAGEYFETAWLDV